MSDVAKELNTRDANAGGGTRESDCAVDGCAATVSTDDVQVKVGSTDGNVLGVGALVKHNALASVTSSSQCPSEGEERLLLGSSSIDIVATLRVDVPLFSVLVEVGARGASVADGIGANGNNSGVLRPACTAVSGAAIDKVEGSGRKFGSGVGIGGTGPDCRRRSGVDAVLEGTCLVLDKNAVAVDQSVSVENSGRCDGQCRTNTSGSVGIGGGDGHRGGDVNCLLSTQTTGKLVDVVLRGGLIRQSWNGVDTVEVQGARHRTPCLGQSSVGQIVGSFDGSRSCCFGRVGRGSAVTELNHTFGDC